MVPLALRLRALFAPGLGTAMRRPALPEIPTECLEAWTTKAVSLVRREAYSLLRDGMQYAALDLLLRSYLPLSGTSTVWVWRGNLFIYYEGVLTGAFHSVYSPELAEALSDLGFSMGVLIDHVRGYEESLRAAEKILPVAGPQCLKAVYLSRRFIGRAPASRLSGKVIIDWAHGALTVTDNNGFRLFSYSFNYDDWLAGKAWPRPARPDAVDAWPLAADPPFNEAQARAVLVQCLTREPLYGNLCQMPALT